MSLWGVRVVMVSSLESLGMSFWDPLGVIFEALGCHFGSFLGHFGSLGGSLGDFLDVWGQTKSYIPPGSIRVAYFLDFKYPKWSKMAPQMEPKWFKN